MFLRSDRLSLPASSDRVVMTEGPWVGGPFPEVYSLEGVAGLSGRARSRSAQRSWHPMTC